MEVIRPIGCVRCKESAYLAAAIGRNIGAIGRHVEPIGLPARSHEFRIHLNYNAVLVETEHVLAGLLNENLAVARSDAGSANTFRDTGLDVIAGR